MIITYQIIYIWHMHQIMHQIMAAMLITVNVFRMTCVSKSQTVAVMLVDSSTSQEILSLQPAWTGSDWFYLMVFGDNSTVKIHVKYCFPFPCFSKCVAGRLVNCSQTNCNGRPTFLLINVFFWSYTIRDVLHDSDHLFLAFPVILQ